MKIEWLIAGGIVGLVVWDHFRQKGQAVFQQTPIAARTGPNVKVNGLIWAKSRGTTQDPRTVDTVAAMPPSLMGGSTDTVVSGTVPEGKALIWAAVVGSGTLDPTATNYMIGPGTTLSYWKQEVANQENLATAIKVYALTQAGTYLPLWLPQGTQL
jgi:hypothetical protein